MKRRIRKYAISLKNAPMIEVDKLYKSDRNKRLKEIDAISVKHEGVKFKQYLDMLEEYKAKYYSIRDTLDNDITVLQAFLIEFGYNTPNYELNALTDDLYALNIIHPSKTYTGFKLDGKYIVGLGYDKIIEYINPLPDDVYNGYWYYDEDNNLKIDTAKYQQIWRV